MTDWNCPGNRTISDLIREAKEMVEKAESIGLVVQSNLSELIRVFRLQIVECYNRAVGDLYFHELTEPLEYALCLAEKYGLDINLVKIKAGREFQVDDLEWFEDEREDEMMPSCRLYGLRLRGSNSESESDSESEMESEVESESELGSESGVEEDEEGDEDEGEEEEEEVSVGSGQASGESEVD
ncbi:uncharacterized protein JCM6883_001369 [Sporobolomyces salmoneus]|uniref:uncharacterized protein n=1 Tax=Sporobolomyces salmoneus TaxID=183962 RepID=UPI00316B1901